MHQYAVTYHCGKDWGEEMVQSVDLGHAVEAEGVEAVEGRMGEQGTVS